MKTEIKQLSVGNHKNASDGAAEYAAEPAKGKVFDEALKTLIKAIEVKNE